MTEMSRIEEFHKGDIVYGEDGHEAEYIAKLDGHHVVRWRYNAKLSDSDYPDEDEGEPRYGAPVTAQLIFADEPTPIFSKKVDQLKLEIGNLQLEKGRVINELAAIKKAANELAATFLSIPALEKLDDFIKGKITHFVTFSYGVIRIQTFAETINMEEWEYGSWPKVKQMRLLSLFGGSKGDLSWQLGSYSTPGGNYALIFPFTSEMDAREYAAELFDKAIVDWRLGVTTINYSMDKVVESGSALGMVAPEDLRLHLKQKAVKAAQDRITARAQELRMAEEALAKLEVSDAVTA